jgi:hypothetical protein
VSLHDVPREIRRSGSDPVRAIRSRSEHAREQMPSAGGRRGPGPGTVIMITWRRIPQLGVLTLVSWVPSLVRCRPCPPAAKISRLVAHPSAQPT